MEKIKIITHPGTAHFDDFFAVALILASFPKKEFMIERREPTQEEIDNENVWVVDIGFEYDESKKNFDHHQDLKVSSSFVLVAEYLNLTSHLIKELPWWDFKDHMDRFGPIKTAKKFIIDDMYTVLSPVESWVIKLFEQDPMEHYDMIKSFGEFTLKKAKKIEERFKFWEEEAELKLVSGKKILVGLTKDLVGLRLYRDNFMKEKASVAVSYDNRGEGWRMMRFNDYENIDFCNVENDKNVAFVHKGGFLAKTKTLIPLENVLDIIKKAII